MLEKKIFFVRMSDELNIIWVNIIFVINYIKKKKMMYLFSVKF